MRGALQLDQRKSLTRRMIKECFAHSDPERAMRLACCATILFAAVTCIQPESPSQALTGSWTLERAQRALEPQMLTLHQIGGTVSGTATIPGLDPVSPGQPAVSVSGSYASPTATLEIRIGTVLAGHYAATLDSANHLRGVFTFGAALGGGSDTLAYDRP